MTVFLHRLSPGRVLWHLVWSASLMLAITAGGLWIASGYWTFLWNATTTGGWVETTLIFEDGWFYLIAAEPGHPSMIRPLEQELAEPNPEGTWWSEPVVIFGRERLAGLGLYLITPISPGSGLYWFTCRAVWLIGLFLILPAVQLNRGVLWLRQWWLGRCLYCGYDLRGSVETCPECGAPISRFGRRNRLADSPADPDAQTRPVDAKQ